METAAEAFRSDLRAPGPAEPFWTIDLAEAAELDEVLASRDSIHRLLEPPPPEPGLPGLGPLRS